MFFFLPQVPPIQFLLWGQEFPTFVPYGRVRYMFSILSTIAICDGSRQSIGLRRILQPGICMLIEGRATLQDITFVVVCFCLTIFLTQQWSHYEDPNKNLVSRTLWWKKTKTFCYLCHIVGHLFIVVPKTFKSKSNQIKFWLNQIHFGATSG